MNWLWSTKRRSRKEMPIAPRWPWPGRWWRICSPWIAEQRDFVPAEDHSTRGGLNRRLREKKQDYTVRRLPGPADGRLSEGEQTPEAPFELFRDWQRTQTQSSVTAFEGLRQQMDVWFCEGRNHRREAHVRAG